MQNMFSVFLGILFGIAATGVTITAVVFFITIILNLYEDIKDILRRIKK